MTPITITDQSQNLHVFVTGCDWLIDLENLRIDEAGRLVLDNIEGYREGRKSFTATFIEDSVKDSDGAEIRFRQIFLFERDLGGKVGEIVLTLRRHPRTNRWMVEGEKERVWLSKTKSIEAWRAKRSGVDNPKHAIQAKRTPHECGDGYLNTRRIGGEPVKLLWEIREWSDQLAGVMLDVYDFVQLLDVPGKATLLTALQSMDKKDARSIFDQIIER